MTREQKIAALLWPKYHARKQKVPFSEVKGESLDCEEIRQQLLLHATWLRRQAEAIRHPLTRWKTLVENPPELSASFPGTCIDDVLEDALEIGQACRAHARTLKRRKRKSR